MDTVFETKGSAPKGLTMGGNPPAKAKKREGLKRSEERAFTRKSKGY